MGKNSDWGKLFLIQISTSSRCEYGASLQFGWVMPVQYRILRETHAAVTKNPTALARARLN